MKKIRESTGMTQKDFAEYFNIPVRTLQDWEYEKRTPPAYVVELIEYKLKEEEIKMKKQAKELLQYLNETVDDYGKSDWIFYTPEGKKIIRGIKFTDNDVYKDDFTEEFYIKTIIEAMKNNEFEDLEKQD